MKKFYSFALLLTLLLSVNAFAGIQSTATVSGTHKGINLKLPAAFSNEHVFAGTLSGSVNSTAVRFYCIDILHNLDYSNSYQDGASTSSKVTYILNNYYPYKPLPYTGALTEVQEAAAVQLAIWSITDGLVISDVTPDNSGDGVVKTRALAIAANAAQNAGTIKPFKTLVINIPAQSFNIGATVTFQVEAYNEVGAPIPNAVISLSVNEGTLSSNSVTTNAAGIAGPVTLTAGPNNNTTITATGKVVIPNGTEYYAVGHINDNQKLVIATPVTDTKIVTNSVTWENQVNLVISKTCATITVNNGDVIEYKISVKNTGSAGATGVQVSDVLPAILNFVSADGHYNAATGIWSAGSVASGETKTLTIVTKANFSAPNATLFSLGTAADYYLFVLNDLNQPSSDTQGKLAVGHDAVLANYSVGDQLPANSGNVLVVGRKLTYKSGRVYNGDVAFGSFIDTTHWNLSDGLITMSSPVNFAAASLYLNDLSQQLSVLAPNGTVTFEYGHLALTGTNPAQNKFLIDGADMSLCNDLSIDVPAGSVVIVNVKGNNITWKGGLELTGATNENILFNFYEAANLKISNIDVKGSILAPKATLDFPSGLISGQVVVLNCTGSGQFNNVKFNGKVTLGVTITNFATLVNVNQPVAGYVPNAMAQVNSSVDLTDVKNTESAPVKFELAQNYPNPFNPSTMINFSIAREGQYTLKVYNTLGQLVKELADVYYVPGSYSVSFDAAGLTSGIYIYQLKGSEINISRKMILAK